MMKHLPPRIRHYSMYSRIRSPNQKQPIQNPASTLVSPTPPYSLLTPYLLPSNHPQDTHTPLNPVPGVIMGYYIRLARPIPQCNSPTTGHSAAQLSPTPRLTWTVWV